jgi:hypothetical protein
MEELSFLLIRHMHERAPKIVVVREYTKLKPGTGIAFSTSSGIPATRNWTCTSVAACGECLDYYGRKYSPG